MGTASGRVEIGSKSQTVDTAWIKVNSTNTTKRTLHIQPDETAGSASGTAGVIVGGTIAATPDTTYKFKVVGSVGIAPISGAAQLTLKGGSGYASGGITLQTPGTGDTTAYTLTLPAETSTLATQNYVSTATANAITTALNTAV
jgi:hypothetical protein